MSVAGDDPLDVFRQHITGRKRRPREKDADNRQRVKWQAAHENSAEGHFRFSGYRAAPACQPPAALRATACIQLCLADGDLCSLAHRYETLKYMAHMPTPPKSQARYSPLRAAAACPGAPTIGETTATDACVLCASRRWRVVFAKPSTAPSSSAPSVIITARRCSWMREARPWQSPLSRRLRVVAAGSA